MNALKVAVCVASAGSFVIDGVSDGPKGTRRLRFSHMTD
jgi:hypothetical protein